MILLALISLFWYCAQRWERTICASLAIALIAGVVGCQSLPHALGRRSPEEIDQAQLSALGAREAIDKGDFDRAKAAFQQALQYTPDDTRIRAQLAQTHAQSGDYDQAIRHMLRVVESTRDPRHHVVLGQMYLADEQLLHADRQAETALARNRKHPEAWVLKGDSHFIKKEYEKAIACYQRALSLDPAQTEVQLKVAETYHLRGQPMRALATLEQLLARFPNNQQPEYALVAKGITLMEVEQLDEAIRLLDEASRREQASVESFLWLGRAQFLAGRESDARTTLNRAMSRFPNQINEEKIAAISEPRQSREGMPRVAWQTESAGPTLTRN